MTPKAETPNNGNGKFQLVVNILSIVSLAGIIGVGIAWGSLNKQVEINTPRIATLENTSILLQKQVERQDEAMRGLIKEMETLRQENNKSHDRIEKGLDRLYSKQVSLNKPEPDFRP